jgi:hypothetical protein
MISVLRIPQSGNYAFAATERDENYLLPAGSFYTLLEKSIRRHNRNFMIRQVDGENQRMVQSLYVKAQEGGYGNLELIQGKVDSLIIGVNLFLDKSGELQVQFIVCDFGGTIKYKSQKLFAAKNGPEKRQLMDVFDEIEDDIDIENVRFRERVIRAINDQVLRDPTMTSKENKFRFEKNWTYANLSQVDMIEMILRSKYGFIFDSKMEDKIVVNRAGGLEFIKEGKRLEIPSLVSVEPIIADTMKFIVDSITLPVDASGEIFGKTPIAGQLLSVHSRIVNVIEKKLPEAFNKPDFDMLEKVFHCSGKCILRGKVEKNDKAGTEKVQYYWDDKSTYINGLRRLVEKERYSFSVDLKLMNLYQDNQSSRFWAVARQSWKTKDRKGAVVYRDDGFLFLNFDFTEGLDKEPEFKIYYRIWIYNYCFDNAELRTSRSDIVERDFNMVFFKSLDDTKLDSGVTGIWADLRKQMRQDLMVEVKKSNSIIMKKK